MPQLAKKTFIIDYSLRTDFNCVELGAKRFEVATDWWELRKELHNL
jgi:hypothetical protein